MGRPPTSLYEVYLASSLRLAYLFRETEPPEGLDVRLHVPLADGLSARTLPNACGSRTCLERQNHPKGSMSDFTFHLPMGFPPGHFPTTYPTLLLADGQPGFQLATRVLVQRDRTTRRARCQTSRSTCRLAFRPDTSQQLFQRLAPVRTRHHPGAIQFHRPVFVLKGGRASSLRLAYLLERQNFGYLCHLVTDQRLPSGSMSPHVPLANWLSTRTHPNKLYHLSGHAPPPLFQRSRVHRIRLVY